MAKVDDRLMWTTQAAWERCRNITRTQQGRDLRRYASHRKSSSIRWARVVNTRAESRAACAAMR